MGRSEQATENERREKAHSDDGPDEADTLCCETLACHTRLLQGPELRALS